MQRYREEFLVFYNNHYFSKPRLPRTRSSRRGGANYKLLLLDERLQETAPALLQSIAVAGMSQLLLVFASLSGEHA